MSDADLRLLVLATVNELRAAYGNVAVLKALNSIVDELPTSAAAEKDEFIESLMGLIAAGRTPKEVAELLGVPVSKVRRRVSIEERRARAKAFRQGLRQQRAQEPAQIG